MIEFSDVFNWFIQTVIAFVASSAFSIIFHAPKKHIVAAGFTGAIGWLIYVILVRYGIDVVLASFFATVGLTVMARVFSYVRKAPVTIFLITGIFPLVPGIGIYSTGYNLFMSDNSATFKIGLQTLEIAIVMAIGMGLVLSLPQIFFSFRRKIKNGEFR